MKGYRTLIANGLSAVIAIAEMQEWTDIIPSEYMPWFAIGLAVANIALRAITTSPVGQK